MMPRMPLTTAALIFGPIFYYLFPIVVSTLVYVTYCWIRGPKTTHIKVERLLREVNMDALILVADSVPTLETTQSFLASSS